MEKMPYRPADEPVVSTIPAVETPVDPNDWRTGLPTGPSQLSMPGTSTPRSAGGSFRSSLRPSTTMSAAPG